MFERRLTTADIILIAGTRVALGMGIGLLLSDRLNRDQRKGAGWALVGLGAATTIPLVLNVIKRGSRVTEIDRKEAA
jgi:hypothetical protein